MNQPSPFVSVQQLTARQLATRILMITIRRKPPKNSAWSKNDAKRKIPLLPSAVKPPKSLEWDSFPNFKRAVPTLIKSWRQLARREEGRRGPTRGVLHRFLLRSDEEYSTKREEEWNLRPNQADLRLGACVGRTPPCRHWVQPPVSNARCGHAHQVLIICLGVLLRPTNHSHVGDFVHKLWSQGFPSLFQICAN